MLRTQEAHVIGLAFTDTWKRVSSALRSVAELLDGRSRSMVLSATPHNLS